MYQFIRGNFRVTWSGIITTNVCYYLEQHFFKFPSAAQTSMQVILTILVCLGMAGLITNSIYAV